MHVLKREHCPRVCCTHHAFSVKKCFYRSWDYVCPVCVYARGFGMWPGEDATSWRNDAASDCLALAVLFRKKTTHLPPNPLKQLGWRKSATSYMQNLRNVVWNFVQNGQTGAWTHHQSLDVLRLRKSWFSYRCPGRHNSQSVSQKLKTWKTNYFCFPFAFLC